MVTLLPYSVFLLMLGWQVLDLAGNSKRTGNIISSLLSHQPPCPLSWTQIFVKRGIPSLFGSVGAPRTFAWTLPSPLSGIVPILLEYEFWDMIITAFCFIPMGFSCFHYICILFKRWTSYSVLELMLPAVIHTAVHLNSILLLSFAVSIHWYRLNSITFVFFSYFKI